MPEKRARIRIQSIKISKYKILVCYQLHYSIVEYIFIFYLLFLTRNSTTKAKN